MFKRCAAWIERLVVYFWPYLLVFALVKITQVILYPNPYMISDTGEYLNTALTFTTNPYKPIGYSLFLALSRVVLPFALGVTILHSLLKLVATLVLAAVLKKHYGFPRWCVLTICCLLSLNPTALLLDHYLLSDSIFISCTIAMMAALLAYIKKRTSWCLLATIALALAAISVRFIGILYPVFLLVAVLLYGGRLKWLQAFLVPVATAALLFGMAARTHHDLGVFKLTTFDGWAFHGTIGPILENNPLDCQRVDDPETQLVCYYMMSFPYEQFRGRSRDFFRWHEASPAKQLLKTFLPITRRPDNTTAVRDSTFLVWFTRLAEDPTTPAQKLFEEFRNKTNPKFPDYVMDHRPAFIVTNELLRKANKEFMRQHRWGYVTDFYKTSLRKLFFPNEPPIVRGKYPYRTKPDEAISDFWPGENSSRWRPRFGDVGGILNWTHQWFVTGMWIVVLAAFTHALMRRKSLTISRWKFLTSVGIQLLASAIIFGAVVAYSHMMEVRYTAPIAIFIIMSASFLYLVPEAPWDESDAEQ